MYNFIALRQINCQVGMGKTTERFIYDISSLLVYSLFLYYDVNITKKLSISFLRLIY